MKAVIMAGGKGTRLRPLTRNCPKPMVPMANRPVLEHIIRLLKTNGVDEILITTHYLPECFTSALGEGETLGVSLRYAIEEKPLGTAGGVKRLEPELTETFLVISGDCLTDFSLKEAVDHHRRHGAAATLVVTEVEDPRSYGIVETDPAGRVVRFLEKPAAHEIFSNQVNTGIYIFDPVVLRLCPSDKPFDFSRDLFPAMLKRGMSLETYRGRGYWSDIGNCAQYIRSHVDILHGRVSLPGIWDLEDRTDRGEWIEPGADISPAATLVSPVMIGRKAVVEAGARVGPGSVIGPRCRVESGAVVERSVIWEGVRIGVDAVVLGAAVGRQAVVESGARLLEGAAVGDRACVPRRRLIPEGETVEAGAR